MDSYGYFPSCGRWEGSHFQPSICKFQAPEYLRLRQCLFNSALVSLVVLGDSQGVRYFEAILELFKSVASHCTRSKVENMKDNANSPGRSYFARGNKTLEEAFQVTERGCRSCISPEWICHFNKRGSQLSVRLENIAMGHVWDESLLIKNTSTLKFEYSFASFQECVFKYYLKISHPGLILFFTPLNHDKHLTDSNMSISFMKMQKVLRENVLSAKIYLIGGTSEFEHRKYGKWANRTFHGNMLSTDIIERYNHINVHCSKEVLSW